MRKLIITLFLFLTFISYAKVQLFNNPIFNKFVKYQDKSIQNFRKVSITLDKNTSYPAGWTISTNGMQVYGGKISSAIAKKRLVLHLAAPKQDIIFYMANRRYNYNQLKNKYLSITPVATGVGSYTPVAYGYDKKGKCIFYKKLSAVSLHKNKMPDVTPFTMQDFPQCENLALGFAFRGKVTLYGASLETITKEEMESIKKSNQLNR